MPKRATKQSPSQPTFVPNRHVFLTGVAILIATVGLVVYDLSIGETLFDGAQVSVLGERTTPSVTPYITPTNTP